MHTIVTDRIDGIIIIILAFGKTLSCCFKIITSSGLDYFVNIQLHTSLLNFICTVTNVLKFETSQPMAITTIG